MSTFYLDPCPTAVPCTAILDDFSDKGSSNDTRILGEAI
jgi:hypothetical protein